VLTFLSRSRDSNDIALAEGLADDIASRLGQVARLAVRSREAVRRVPNAQGMSVRQLGHELNAAYLLGGTVQPSGERLRIVVELTRVQSMDVVWSSPFDRGRNDILEIQAEIAIDVARTVAGRLQTGESRVLRSAPTRNAAAFAHITRGSVFLMRRNFRHALPELREAVRLDPAAALAWARLAQGYALCVRWGCALDSASILRARAREATDRALALDSGLADAWLADGVWWNNAVPFDLPAARRSLQRAVRLDPQNAEAQHVLAFTLARLGDEAGAALAYRKALAIDPGRAITWSHLGRLAFVQGRFSDAEALLDTSLALQPGFRDATGVLWFDLVLGEGVAAKMRGLAARHGLTEDWRGPLEEAYARLAEADTAGARNRLDTLLSLGSGGTNSAEPASGVFTGWAPLALLMARCGRRDEVGSLVRTWDDPGDVQWYTLRSPAFQPLHGIPEFDAYLERARVRVLRTAESPR
jgi:TolB-like protein